MINNLSRTLMLALCLSLAACGEPELAAEPADNPRVATLEVAAADGYTQRSGYTGRVEARLDSALGFEIGGLLATVAVDEGHVVARGDTLAVLDTARLDAQRAQAKAAVAEVRAQLALARSTAARTEEALGYKGVSQQQMDESNQSVNTLAAAEQAAVARLASIEVDIAKATLKAPFDGVVVTRFADPGQVLAPGQQMLRLQSVGRMETRIGMAPSAAAALETGTRYEIEINDVLHGAVLKTVVPRRDERTRTVDALFVVEHATDAVRPGDLARFDADTWVASSGFWIPLAALNEGPRGLWQALVVEASSDGSHTLANRTVEIVHAESDRAFVRGTLAAGELLVSEGIHRVVAGQRVEIGNVVHAQRVVEFEQGE